jgi:4-hydroxy-tetrahydrodipicolinate reductase
LKFGKLIAEAMGQETHRHGRQGETGQRPKSEIGYHAVRAGDDPGQHTILFALLGELIELRVAASNRDCYALGALTAAKFLVNRNPGMWSMNDVLGIDV